MKSTYINEEFTSAYPFAESQALPFPMSVITELSISYKETLLEEGETLYVASVVLSQDVVRISIASDSRLFGTISCNIGSGKAGIFSPEAWVADIHGFMFIGLVPTASYGAYAGHFKISPSCVFPIPSAVTGRYSFFDVNGVRVSVGRELRLSIYGGIGLSASGDTLMIERTLAAPAANLAVSPSDYAYTKVDSINGVAGDKLVLSTEAEGGSVISLDLFEKDLDGSIVAFGEGTSREDPPENPPAGDLIIGVINSAAGFSSCFTQQESEE